MASANIPFYEVLRQVLMDDSEGNYSGDLSSESEEEL